MIEPLAEADVEDERVEFGDVDARAGEAEVGRNGAGEELRALRQHHRQPALPGSVRCISVDRHLDRRVGWPVRRRGEGRLRPAKVEGGEASERRGADGHAVDDL